MASQIQLTRSGTTGVQPAASELEYGELALNYADGKLFYKDDQNALQQLNDTYKNSNNTIFVNSIDTHIGLKTTSPEYLLDLGGAVSTTDNTLRINQTTGGTAIRIGSDGVANGEDITLLRVDNLDGETNSAAEGFSIKYLGSNSNNELAVFTDNQSGSAIQALTILQNGNIGIGVATPAHELDVAGTIKVTDSTNFITLNNGSEDMGFILNNSGKLAINAGGTADVLQLQTNGGTRVHIDNVGKVGIGTTAPYSNLTVKGVEGADTASFTLENSGGARVHQYYNGSASTDDFYITRSGTGGSEITLQSDGDLILNGANGDNVGIGTTSPSVKLEVVGNVIAATPTASTHLTTKAYVDGRITAAEYRPGEVIEGFSALCNGRSVTLTGGTYTTHNQTTFHISDANNNMNQGGNPYTLYNGAKETGQRSNHNDDAGLTEDLVASIIKYKLPVGAKRILYTFHLEVGRHDDSWSIIEFTTFIGDGAGSNQKNANYTADSGDELYTRLEHQAFTSPYHSAESHNAVTINLEITDVLSEENVAQGIIYRGNWPADGRTLIVNVDSYNGSYDGKMYSSTHQDGVHDNYFVRPWMEIQTYA